MSDLKLEPYAARLRWELTNEAGGDELSRLLSEFVGTLARLCDAAGKCVIGHIKGFAALPGGGYLRVNAVSPRLPADVSVQSSGPVSEFTLTLNVLVYGHSADLLQRITEEAASVVAARCGARADSFEQHYDKGHHHHHDS